MSLFLFFVSKLKKYINRKSAVLYHWNVKTVFFILVFEIHVCRFLSFLMRQNLLEKSRLNVITVFSSCCVSLANYSSVKKQILAISQLPNGHHCSHLRVTKLPGLTL